jgi:DNA-binding transcriptional LysR family regulator
MDWPYDALRTFARVAREGSFSHAGRELGRTQSAISLQVARLEQAASQRLLDRTTRRVELTEAGRILLGYFEQSEALLEQAARELEDLDTLERGRLVICTSDTSACYRLPTILKRYRAAHPGIEIEIRNATSPRTIEAVVRREVDLGIATLRELPEVLEATPLFPRRDVMICHPEHKLARRRRVRLKDLEGYAFILLDENCSSRRLLDVLCGEAGVQLSISMELSSIEVIKHFVRIDVGLSVVPAAAIEEELAAGQLAQVEIRDFEHAPRVDMGVVHMRGRYLSRAARSFLEELIVGAVSPARARRRPASE